MNRPLQIETPACDAGALRVEFLHSADRYSHRILLVEAGAATLLLTSQEGTAEDYWPPSPPLQQLSIEDRGPLQVALAVGMAGSSHWSMSVETAPGRLLFDIACRRREEPLWLGSRYIAASAAPRAITLQPVGAGVNIVTQESTPEAATRENGYRIAATAGGDTVQWKYAVAIHQ